MENGMPHNSTHRRALDYEMHVFKNSYLIKVSSISHVRVLPSRFITKYITDYSSTLFNVHSPVHSPSSTSVLGAGIGFAPRDSGKSPQRFPGSPRPDRHLSLQKAHLMKSWHISLRTAALILVDLVCPHLWNNFPVIAILCSCMHSVSNYFVRR